MCIETHPSLFRWMSSRHDTNIHLRTPIAFLNANVRKNTNKSYAMFWSTFTQAIVRNVLKVPFFGSRPLLVYLHMLSRLNDQSIHLCYVEDAANKKIIVKDTSLAVTVMSYFFDRPQKCQTFGKSDFVIYSVKQYGVLMRNRNSGIGHLAIVTYCWAFCYDQ